MRASEAAATVHPQMLLLQHTPCYLCYDGSAEIDAMWRFVGKKTQQRWL